MLFCSYLFRLIGPKTKFNDIAQINLKYIWPHIKKNEIDKICIKMWENLGKNIGEFSFLHKLRPYQ